MGGAETFCPKGAATGSQVIGREEEELELEPEVELELPNPSELRKAPSLALISSKRLRS